MPLPPSPSPGAQKGLTPSAWGGAARSKKGLMSEVCLAPHPRAERVNRTVLSWAGGSILPPCSTLLAPLPPQAWGQDLPPSGANSPWGMESSGGAPLWPGLGGVGEAGLLGFKSLGLGKEGPRCDESVRSQLGYDPPPRELGTPEPSALHPTLEQLCGIRTHGPGSCRPGRLGSGKTRPPHSPAPPLGGGIWPIAPQNYFNYLWLIAGGFINPSVGRAGVCSSRPQQQ